MDPEQMSEAQMREELRTNQLIERLRPIFADKWVQTVVKWFLVAAATGMAYKLIEVWFITPLFPKK